MVAIIILMPSEQYFRTLYHTDLMVHIYMFQRLTGHQEDFPHQVWKSCNKTWLWWKQVNKTKPFNSITEHRPTR